jgi:hypothetical protein
MPVIGRFRLRREGRRAFLQHEVRSIVFRESLLGQFCSFACFPHIAAAFYATIVRVMRAT